MNHALRIPTDRGVTVEFLTNHPGLRTRWTQATCPCKRCRNWRVRLRVVNALPNPRADIAIKAELKRNVAVLDVVAVPLSHDE